MPDHRFLEELELLEQYPIKGNFKVLVIGTFNAADQKGLKNDAAWFYGRSKNQFWYLLPQVFGYNSLHRTEHPDLSLETLAEEWKLFCKRNGVIIIDLYKSVKGELTNHTDKIIENPEFYEPFNYQQAFVNCNFDYVLFTWKGRNLNNTLGKLKEEAHHWFSNCGSVIHHMMTPSPNYRKSRDWKLKWWLNELKGL